eukprot:CAMPEP_0172700232 /NCGR_PEP_ID=MMETSP1074-20121228/30762_1 /TAXON_ID=2916 /ORGANISM="Ceratium fusus, Strain PA161109" /LENGTH=58 /DNA_ID=CAMNT_0013521577 /DNA_START=32 /DNA_END=204 /DNA_ORIENTATION=+
MAKRFPTGVIVSEICATLDSNACTPAASTLRSAPIVKALAVGCLAKRASSVERGTSSP